jgi:hypothetical protein
MSAMRARKLNTRKKKVLTDKAKKLKGKVKPNSISMDDILEEIEMVRNDPSNSDKSALAELMKDKKWEIEHDEKRFHN